MATDTCRIPWTCTLPVSWADRAAELSAPKDARKWSPTCFAEFATEAERDAHQRIAHADYLADAPVGFAGAAADPAPEPTPSHAPVAPTPSVDVPTAKQIAMIEALAERKGVEANEVGSKQEASAEIDRLMALPDKGLRANRYDAPCSECGAMVAAGEGIVRQVDGAWLVAHADGSCATERKPVGVPDGYYAVMAEAGHLSFYRVKAGRKPGVVFVDLLLGGGTNGSLSAQKVPWKNVPSVLAKIAEDPAEAMAEFGRNVGRCGRCNRGLTDETSRALGIGPECRKKD